MRTGVSPKRIATGRSYLVISIDSYIRRCFASCSCMGSSNDDPLIASCIALCKHINAICNSRSSLDNLTAYEPLLLFLRKEVIQPHLPIRLPCYDFTPVIGPAFGGSLQKVKSPTSGITDSHGVTGGVYKTRERIHRSILICDY